MLKLQKLPKTYKQQKTTKMHYEITIFGSCAPYPRLIYWIASSILPGKKMTYHQISSPDISNFQNDSLNVKCSHSNFFT